MFVPGVPTNTPLRSDVISKAIDLQPRRSTPSKHSASVQIDPDMKLSSDERASFRAIIEEYDDVFDPNYTGYNGHVGPFEAVVNMGPVQPPQRKGRLPQYARNQLVELQSKFDELETMGVVVRPEDVPVNVEYLNPSFLVKKRNGGHRLVTAFTDVGRYSKPQPSLMPDVDSTLRKIAQWKYIATTDLSNAFYQIPLSRESMRYCGVVTPFRGVRVYALSAMGMPGSETALEELLCRILGVCCKKAVSLNLQTTSTSAATPLLNFNKTSKGCYNASPTVVCDYQPPRQRFVRRQLPFLVGYGIWVPFRRVLTVLLP